jgi:hypothetical protein
MAAARLQTIGFITGTQHQQPDNSHMLWNALVACAAPSATHSAGLVWLQTCFTAFLGRCPALNHHRPRSHTATTSLETHRQNKRKHQAILGPLLAPGHLGCAYTHNACSWLGSGLHSLAYTMDQYSNAPQPAHIQLERGGRQRSASGMTGSSTLLSLTCTWKRATLGMSTSQLLCKMRASG